MTKSAPNWPLIRIFWDTNIFVQLILQGHSKQIDYLQGLIRQHEQGLIELICPRVVQAELYGILKAGRIKRVKACSHEQIMYLLEPFFDLFFDREFMNRIGTKTWPEGAAYKSVWRAIISDY